jgi:hypothetical protein
MKTIMSLQRLDDVHNAGTARRPSTSSPRLPPYLLCENDFFSTKLQNGAKKPEVRREQRRESSLSIVFLIHTLVQLLWQRLFYSPSQKLLV